MTEKNKHRVEAETPEKETAEEATLNTANEIKEKLAEIQENIIDYAKNHPAQAIGFSLLAGALIAQFFRSRH